MRYIFLAIALLICTNAQAQIIRAEPFYVAPEEAVSGNLLLDDYPGAAVAYSLRKLDKDYTGSAIRVRRSSDNTEQDIGFVNNYLDTAAMKTFVGANDGFVVTWYNQADSAAVFGVRNATQGTAANQPQIIASGSLNLYNSIVALKFDGSNDNVAFSFQFTGSIAFISAHEDGTQSASGSYHKTLISARTDPYVANSNGYALSKAREGVNGATATVASTDASEQSILVTYAKASAKELLYFQALSGNSEIFKNNSSIGTDTYTAKTSGFSSIYEIGDCTGSGSGRKYTGNIYEIVAYNSDQSANRSGISSNINSFYSIY